MTIFHNEVDLCYLTSLAKKRTRTAVGEAANENKYLPEFSVILDP